MLLEGALVCASLCGVLTVDKRVILLTILVGMGEGYLYVLALHVHYRVERFAGHLVAEQVLQTIS